MSKMIAPLKWMAIITSSIVGLYILYIVYLFCFSFDSDRTYSKQDLIDNYKRNEIRIDWVTFVNNMVPPGVGVDIEFGKLSHFTIFYKNGGTKFCDWDGELRSPKTDSILQTLHWSRSDLKALKQQLDAANCISVRSGEPCKIGFKRSGMGMYFYNIFDEPITDDLKSQYNDSCKYILYSDKVVLEYDGGTIRPHCFPKDK